MKKFTLSTLAFAIGVLAYADPDRPTDFVMNLDLTGGEPVVAGSFVAPLYQWGWSDPKTPIEKITKVEVLRSCDDLNEVDVPVFTLEEELQPGAKVEVTDNVKGWEFGHEYSYYARVYDENNDQGFGASCYLYLGIQPQKPELSAAMGENGQLPVTLTVVAPTQTSDGKDLTVPLTQLLLVQYVSGFGEMELTSFADPKPGQTYTWAHEDAEANKTYSYRAYAVCDYGKSEKASVEIYAGMDAPAAPLNLAIAKNEDKSITLTWEAPVNGAAGGNLDPASVRYKVSRLGDETKVLAEELTDCSYTDNLEDLSEPSTVKYEVRAYNNVGNGGVVSSEELIAGPAYSLPFTDEFNSRQSWYRTPDKIWTFEPGNSNWEITSESYSLNDLSGMDAVESTEEIDGREGFAHADLRYGKGGDVDTMTSADIDFTKASYPVATFYVAGKKSDYDATLAAGIKDGESNIELLNFVPANDQQGEEVAWKRYVLPLEEAAGKEASIYFTTTIPENAESYKCASIGVDKLTIADYPGVAEIKFGIDDDNLVTLTWDAPVNSFENTPDSYDIIVDGNEPQNIADASFSFQAPEDDTRADNVVKVSLRANYGDINGKYSPDFEVVISSEENSVAAIVDGMAAKVEYFDINGYAVKNPVKGSTIIRRSITKDGNVMVEKMIAK